MYNLPLSDEEYNKFNFTKLYKMLLEKYDSQFSKPVASPFLANSKNNRVSSNGPNQKDSQMPELNSFRPIRKGSLNIRDEKVSLGSDDSFLMRMPKISHKNLPEVFFMNTPHTRREK